MAATVQGINSLAFTIPPSCNATWGSRIPRLEPRLSVAIWCSRWCCSPRYAADVSENMDGVIDVLGLLAYASLVAFFRLADDASLALSLPDKADLAGMAVAEFGHFDLLRRRIT